MISGYVAWTEKLTENKKLLLLFIYINIAGTVVGLFTYGRSMAQTPPSLWVMLMDCPIYPALMVFILTFRKNKFIQKFCFLAFYGLIKYGLWTITAWSIYHEKFLMQNTFYNSLIFVGHFGMVLEAGFVARRAAKSESLEILLPVAWMFTNDFFDYGLGTHPPLPDNKYLGLLLTQNLALNILIPVFLFYIARKDLEKNVK